MASLGRALSRGSFSRKQISVRASNHRFTCFSQPAQPAHIILCMPRTPATFAHTFGLWTNTELEVTGTLPKQQSRRLLESLYLPEAQTLQDTLRKHPSSERPKPTQPNLPPISSKAPPPLPRLRSRGPPATPCRRPPSAALRS